MNHGAVFALAGLLVAVSGEYVIAVPMGTSETLPKRPLAGEASPPIGCESEVVTNQLSKLQSRGGAHLTPRGQGYHSEIDVPKAESGQSMSDGQWSEIVPSGPGPSPRCNHSMIYDPVRDRLVVFGGRHGGFQMTNETWILSLSGTPTWTPLSPGGVVPVARWGHTAVYSPLYDRMVVFGGFGSSAEYLNLDPAENMSGPFGF